MLSYSLDRIHVDFAANYFLFAFRNVCPLAVPFISFIKHVKAVGSLS